jgi:hypothetical protein
MALHGKADVYARTQLLSQCTITYVSRAAISVVPDKIFLSVQINATRI